MIGKSFVELMRQPESAKDTSLAQGVAYGQCKEPDDYGSAVLEGVEDTIDESVRILAKEVLGVSDAD
jgi:hypothetical protein